MTQKKEARGKVKRQEGRGQQDIKRQGKRLSRSKAARKKSRGTKTRRRRGEGGGEGKVEPKRGGQESAGNEKGKY